MIDFLHKYWPMIIVIVIFLCLEYLDHAFGSQEIFSYEYTQVERIVDPYRDLDQHYHNVAELMKPHIAAAMEDNVITREEYDDIYDHYLDLMNSYYETQLRADKKRIVDHVQENIND